jgi:hypothetical protein
MCHRVADFEAREQRLDQVMERGLADPSQCERGQRDAELRRRQIRVEMADEPFGHLRADASGLRELSDLRRPHFDDRELGRDEKTVRKHEEKGEYE